MSSADLDNLTQKDDLFGLIAVPISCGKQKLLLQADYTWTKRRNDVFNVPRECQLA